MIKTTSSLQGILLMVAAMACFAAMNTAIRALSSELVSTQMVFLRNLASLALIAAIVLTQPSKRNAMLKTHRLSRHFWRAAIGFAAMETWFYSMSIMPVTVATALSFTTPIFVTIFAILFFGEKAGIRRWSAILMGFAGVVIILRPGMEAMHVSASFVLLSSALMAFASTVVKSLSRTEPPEVIVFYMALFMTPLSLPFAIPHWQPVSLFSWGLIALIAIFSTAAHLFLTRAYTKAEMVVLMPFDFTRLIFVAILGYIFFGEVLDAASWLGAAIIAGSTIYIAWREAKLDDAPVPEKISVP